MKFLLDYLSKNHQNKNGFTLVELAIVLVIIGLLVGGVLQGQELIRQANIRNVISQITEYDTAINTFRAKYRQIPGDIDHASAYGINCPDIGSACTGGSAGTENMSQLISSAGTDGAQGNGDNDSSLESTANNDTAGAKFAHYDGEIANFWVHLANTMLVKGGFNQIDDCVTTNCLSTPGTNLPSASIGKGIIALTEGGRIFYVLGTAGNYDSNFNAIAGTAGSLVTNELTPIDAFEIDSKLDDGIAITGVIQTISRYNSAAPWGLFSRVTGGNTSTDCHTTTGVYNLTNSRNLCTVKIRAAG